MMTIEYMNHESVLKLLPDRDLNSHKGTFGKILLLCGSRGYTGAAALAAMAALRSGAGLVYLGVPESIYEIEAVKLLEPIVFPLDDDNGKLATSAIGRITYEIEGKDAVLMGPGLGRSDGVLSAVCSVVERFTGPLILDADGINVLANHKQYIKNRQFPTILTPHKVEFERLGICIDDSDDCRVEAAGTLANELGVIVLLKGHRTVITDGTRYYINTTGNPGMAVGGSGDVLAGIITALLGQGLRPLEAAACGAWLHGRAGDLCAQKFGQYGMLPSDILTVLPQLLK